MNSVLGSLLSVFGPLVAAAVAGAQSPADTSIKVTTSAFVDSYYAWDFGRPASMDRSFASGALFTTQPARHNEFNVNLAFVDATLTGQRVHGRLALQAGTSVQSNYGSEATIGVVSGPSLARYIQEAYGGTKIGNNLWVDGGIFFSHIGMEGWISRDNPTYTRSLVADYTPYYSSGVRAVWKASPRLTTHLHVVNGWQNISENNSGKGVGVRVDYAPAASTLLSYYNFFTDETGNLLRVFNGVGAKYAAGNVTLLGEADVGSQDGSAGAPRRSWSGLVAIARLQLNGTVAVSGRAERYDDKDGVILVTGVPGAPFQANGGSVGIDVAPAPMIVWRVEARGWANKSAVFPDGPNAPRKSDGFIVSSMALTF